MGHSCQTNTVKIPLDLVIQPRHFFNVSAFLLLIPRQHRQRQERSIFGLFNRVSLESAGTCCAHRTTCFSTAVPLREEGGWTGTTKLFLLFIYFFLNGGLVCAHLCSSVVMLSRKYSGGDRLSCYTALSCRKYASKSCEALWLHFC